MVTINSVSDYTNLKSKLDNNGVWIGYTKNKWCFNGECFTFNSKWKSTTSCEGANKKCIISTQDGLDCEDCNEKRKAVCKAGKLIKARSGSI